MSDTTKETKEIFIVNNVEEVKRIMNHTLCKKCDFGTSEPVGESQTPFHHQQFDLTVNNIKTDGINGAELIEQIQNQNADSIVVIVNGTDDCTLKEVNKKLQAEIAGHKKTEEALRQSLKELSNLKQALDISAIVSVTNAEGIITHVNDKFCEISKYMREEIVGKSHEEFASEFDLTIERRKILKTIYGGKPWQGSVKGRDKDGGFYWTDATIVPIMDGESELPVQYITIRTETTKLKQTEEALRREGHFLQTLMDNLPDAIYFKDTESRFTRVSKHKVDKHLYLDGVESAEDFIGKTDLDFFTNEHAEQAYSDEQEIIRTGKPIIDLIEKETFHNGTVGWVITTKVPLRDETGQITGIVGASRNITELKQMEEDLSKARDMVLESARLKSEFLANMSHEIRTPMNGVIGMTGLLMDTKLDEAQRDYVETIRSSADALLTIINDILDFSKIEAKKLELEIIDFDLRNIVESTCDLLSERAQTKGLEFVVNIDPNIPLRLRGDAGRIRQVLTNLLGNSIKFTSKGEVILRVEKMSETETTTCIKFSVSDTGIGIAHEMMKLLFQPFTQADGSTTRKYGGTGLGLTISKQLVELMNGSISVESVQGLGTTFTFTLDFEKQHIQLSTANKFSNDLRRLNILIVDDSVSNCMSLKQQFDSFGMRCACVFESTQAIKVLQAAQANNDAFDFVLLDMQMPGIDGLQLSNCIRESVFISETRLILLKSVVDSHQPLEYSGHNFYACLTKPVKQSQLFDCLASAIYVEGYAKESSSKKSSPGVMNAKMFADAESERKNLRILLAEDNAINQKVAINQLKQLGYHTEAVANGLEALDALAKFPFDLVLMDCQMPEMDGYEATKEIRRFDPQKQPVIVAMTAHALEGDHEKCIDAGMDDYISKPVNRDELHRILSYWEDVIAARNASPLASFDGDSQTPAVDKQHLWDISLGDPQEVLELIEIVLSNLKENIAGLEDAVRGGKYEVVKKISHSCAGASANCGITTLGQIWRELEQMALSLKPIKELEEKATEVFIEFKRAETELKKLVGEIQIMPKELVA